MGRIGRGWALTKKSWSVVKADRSLLGFAVISVIAAVICAGVFFGAGAGLVALTDADWTAVPLVVIGLYLLVVIAVFCGVALSACATRALDGQDTTVREGLSAAWARIGKILAWAAVQLVVGALISALQSMLRQGAGAIIGGLLGGLANFAWTVATFFVIPGIALEGLGPKDALTRSSRLIRERWGEGLIGTAAIGLIAFLLGFLPGALLIGAGLALAQTVPALTVALVTIGVIVIAVTALLQTTVATVFKVALFRFASGGQVLGPFTQQELSHAFARRGQSVAS